MLISLLGSGLAAQTDAQKKDEVQRALDQARRYERLNRYEEALNVHMGLYQTHPDNPHVLSGIERDLLHLKRYEELIELLQDRLTAQPDNPSLLEKFGNALYQSGQQEKADETWSRIIELAPDQKGSYASVARQYLYNGLFDKSVATYLLGRRRIGEPALFARDLANLYTSQMEYEKATEEFIRLLQDNPKQYSYVENMISRFKFEEGGDNGVVEVLEDAVEDAPGNSLFRRLLGTEYLRLAEPEEAFEQYIEVDDIEQTKGATLLEFGDWAYREGHYSVAMEAYDRLLEQYPESPLSPKAHQGIGRSLAKGGRFEEAISVFRTLCSDYPGSNEAEFGLFEIGRIQLRELGQPDSALVAFSELVEGRKRTRHYFEAMFLIGECYFVKNDLASAEQQYEQVKNEAQKAPPVAEEAAFRMIEMQYFRGDFDGALEELERMVQTFPRGMFTNDAIALMVFIEENRLFGDDALRAFTTAALLERQQKFEEAIEAYRRISTYYSHSYLGDDALLRIGAIQNSQGKHEVALETYRNLLETYPDCDQGDEVQRRIGEIYELKLHDLPKAIEAYEDILSKYPGSLLYDTVRKKIRELQVQIGGTG
jgi:tetratricopeptide (TPR) repeat protein